MKITEIRVENFLGIASAAVAIDRPTTIFAGANHSGKSSLKEAVRMALTGESVRVDLKKDYPALVTDGAKNGYAQVVMGEQSATIVLPKGATSVEGGYVMPPVLPYLLDAQRFASQDDKGRRVFLFGLMGLKTDIAAVTARLLAKGLDETKIDRVQPLLRTGFEGACTEAKAKGTEAKGAWRGMTGETYGAVKAKTWAAEKPVVDLAAITAAEQKVASIDTQLADANQNVGTLQAQSEAHNTRAARIAALEGVPERVGRLQAKLKTDEVSLAEWETKVEDLAAKANGEAAGKPLTCPHCAALVELTKDGSLAAYAAPTKLRDLDAAAALPDATKARDLLRSAVANGRRDLHAAESQAAELSALSEGDQPAAPAQAALDEARALVTDLNGRRSSAATALQASRASKVAAEAAEQKTKAAAAHHADVEAWDAIAIQLAPDGLPSALLAEALGPINSRMAQSAADANWPAVEIHADMRVTSGGRAYKLLSESEQWRVDAVITEAISHQSGLKLLVLDRFDVLDVPGRGNLLAWLEVLADAGELDTALLFGTLKSLPSTLPPSVAGEWISNGRVGHLLEAA